MLFWTDTKWNYGNLAYFNASFGFINTRSFLCAVFLYNSEKTNRFKYCSKFVSKAGLYATLQSKHYILKQLYLTR
jgi:hypothetical protein